MRKVVNELSDAYSFMRDPVIKKALDELERVDGVMNEAMDLCLKQWRENGCKDDDQFGIVALLLAHGLGLTDRLDAGGE
jgi:hypothetical protein